MKPPRLASLLVVSLLLSIAGCGYARPLAPWVPGTYLYMSTIPGSGAVAGRIEVGADGPLSVTSNVGACRPRIETVPRRLRERLDGQLLGRAFLCGTDHRLSVTLGRDGAPPIEGTVSNQRTDTLTTYGETTCRQYQTLDTGERICIAWNWGAKRELRTTGGSARWYLVSDSLASRP